MSKFADPKSAADLASVPPCLEKSKEAGHAMEVLDRHMWSKEEVERFERVLHAERVQRSVMETALIKEKCAIAKQMLAEELDTSLIAKVTGLSEEAIKNLKR